MTRARTLPDPPPYADLFGTTESPLQAESGSHTTRQDSSHKLLERMALAFRSLEAFRTLAWMRIEDGDRKEAVETLREWEDAVRHTREDYERLA